MLTIEILKMWLKCQVNTFSIEKMICGEERRGGLCLIYLIYKIEKHLENNVETLSNQLSLC